MRPWRPPPGSPKKDPPPRERRAGAHGQHDAIHPGPHQAHTAGPDPPEQTCADGPPPITEATQPPMPSEEEGESQDQNRSQSRRNQGPRTCWPVALPGPPDREGGTQVGGVRAPPPADSPERSTRGEGSRGANLTWTPGTRGNRKPTASRGEGAREGRRVPSPPINRRLTKKILNPRCVLTTVLKLPILCMIPSGKLLQKIKLKKVK